MKLPFSSAAALVFAAALSACAHPTSGPVATPSPPASACNADAARFAIGQQADAALLQEAQRRAGAARVRTLAPGQVMTMEFAGDRLNLQVDAGNRVTAVRCG
jgi:hypothetical protein